MTPTIDLIRLENSFDGGALGALRICKQMFCATLEPADRDNQPDVSCIPAGQYRCRRIQSPRFWDTFEVQHVPGRSHILFHPGNRQVDTAGCILVGRTWGQLSGDRAILNSGNTFERFMIRMKGIDEFVLTITESY